MARRQGIMTDEEYQTMLEGAVGMRDNIAEMAEGPDLASTAVGDSSVPVQGKVPEGKAPRTDEGPNIEGSVEVEKPPVTKKKTVKRKLVLKAGGQKPQRVSQRCLGRGMAKNAGANTAVDAVMISSEGEETTLTKPAEESPSPISQKDAPIETDVIPPSPNAQEEKIPTTPGEDPMDVPSRPVEEEVVDAPTAEPTTQEGPSDPTKKVMNDESEEERYQQARKRKWKAPMKTKKSSKKPRTADTGGSHPGARKKRTER